MAYTYNEYGENNQDDVSCYFDDDSSAEEELLRVTEKLEKTHQEDEENREEAKMKGNLTIQDFGESNASQLPVSDSPHDYSQSSSSSSSSSSIQLVPTSIEIRKHKGEEIAKYDVTTKDFDNDLHGDTKNSVGLYPNSNGDNGTQSRASHREDELHRRKRIQSKEQQTIRPVTASKTIRTVAPGNNDVNGEHDAKSNIDRYRMQEKQHDSSPCWPSIYSHPQQRKKDRQETITENPNRSTTRNNDYLQISENELNEKIKGENDNDPPCTAPAMNRVCGNENRLDGSELETNSSILETASDESSYSSSNGSVETSLSDDSSTSISSSSFPNTAAKNASESILTKKKSQEMSMIGIPSSLALLQQLKNPYSTTTLASSLSSPLETQKTGASNGRRSGVTTFGTKRTRENSSNILKSSEVTHNIATIVTNTGKTNTSTKDHSNYSGTISCPRSSSLPRFTPPKATIRNPYLRERNVATCLREKKSESSSSDKLRKSDKQSFSPLKRSKEVDVGNVCSDAVSDAQTITAIGNQEMEASTSKQAQSSSKQTRQSAQMETIVKESNGSAANVNVNDDSMESIIANAYRKELQEESEVSPQLFAPPIHREDHDPPPKVHKFDLRNHPLHSRKTLPVRSSDCLFPPTIVNSLWSKNFHNFNPFQSTMFNVLSNSDDNVVLSAPTGAGKSTIFEMAVARFLAMDLKAQEQITGPSSVISKARKIVYIAPSKALCEERYTDWSQKLKSMNLGLEVSLITGQDAGSEQAMSSFTDLIDAHLIVTTPEKWDAMTRRWNEKFFLFATVKLLLLDEVHLLGDLSRGWCLESVITRMKTIHRAARKLDTTVDNIRASSYAHTNPEAIRSNFRIVAVSATLPNISDVADFVEAKEAYTFDDSYRPIALTKHVNAMGRVGKNEFRFWSKLIDHVPEIVKRFSHGKQSLIFCHSKKQTQQVMDLLIERKIGNGGDQTSGRRWNEPVDKMIAHGIACHHAGMSKVERKRIEEAFLNKKIRCLAATSTLAVGVNLPAHLVIIVGTKAYRRTKKGKGSKAGYEDIEVNTLLQMVGRAGRPGLDSTGVAVVLTDHDSKNRIESLMQVGLGPVKSNLIPRLPEVVNSEISQQVITSKKGALQWLSTTFLFSTMKKEKNPISSAKNLVNEAVAQLKEIGMLVDGSSDLISPAAGSFIMNKRLMSFEEMETIAMFPCNVTECQILRSVSKLQSLQSNVRNDQKRELKEFHKNQLMKYKLPGRLSEFRVKDESEKVFILVQSYISRHRFANRILNEEQITVRNEALKFLEAAQEYCVRASKNGKVAFECHKLQRSVIRRLWGESSGVFNQFDWIGSSTTGSNTLAFGGIRTFQDALESSEDELDDLFAKAKILGLPTNPGREVKHTVNDLCRRRLRLSAFIQYTRNSNTPTDLVCQLKYNDPTVAMARTDRGEQDFKFSLIAYTDDAKQTSLIFEDGIHSSSCFSVPLPSHPFSKIYIHLVGTWLGFDDFQTINVRNDKMLVKKSHNRQRPNPRAKHSEIEIEQSGTEKKRKFHLTGQKEWKKHCIDLTEESTKEPSPITPLNHHRSGQAVQASDHSIPSAHRPTENSPTFKNITPIMHLPRSNTSFHGQGSSDMSKQEVHQSRANLKNQTDDPIVAKYVQSELSAREESHERRSAYKNQLQRGYRYPRNSRASVANENIECLQSVWNEPEDTCGSGGLHRELPRGRTENFDRPVDNSTSRTVRSRNQEKHHWKQSRKKQQRAQKRAFSEKKMNPFSFFSHDPNDSERHLEQLSQQNNSIIPSRVRAKLKQSSISSNRKGNSQFSSSQDRRTKPLRNRHSTLSPRQVLRQKAFEQQDGHQRMMPQTEHNPNCTQCHHRDEGNFYTATPLAPVNFWQRNVQDHVLEFAHESPLFHHQLRDSHQYTRSSAFHGSQNIPAAAEVFENHPSERNTYYHMHGGLNGDPPGIFRSPKQIQARTEEISRLPWSNLIRYPEDQVDTYSQLSFPFSSSSCQPQNRNSSNSYESNFSDAFY